MLEIFWRPPSYQYTWIPPICIGAWVFSAFPFAEKYGTPSPRVSCIHCEKIQKIYPLRKTKKQSRAWTAERTHLCNRDFQKYYNMCGYDQWGMYSINTRACKQAVFRRNLINNCPNIVHYSHHCRLNLRSSLAYNKSKTSPRRAYIKSQEGFGIQLSRVVFE